MIRPIDAATDSMRKTEARLRALVAEAAASGDYDATELLTGIARALKGLIESLPCSETSTGIAAAPSKPNGSPAAHEETSGSGQKRRVTTAYPRFVRAGDNLVKIAWSKRSKAEYEHKAPQAVLTVLARTLHRLGADGKRVTMAELLPLKHPANGSEIPDYQAYLCLAWLRSSKLLRQHGRQGYSIPRGTALPTLVPKHWDELPVR